LRAPLGWLGPGALVPDVQVVCEAGVIQRVEHHGPVSENAEVLAIDGVLMPAAADRHVHIELADPVAVVRGGVTAVRDLGWPPARSFALADASELVSFNGPLVRAVGPILTAPAGYPTRATWAPEGTGRELEGPADAVQVVADLASRGAAAIKVSLNAEAGPTPTDAELMALVEAARAAGVPVTAHAQGEGQVERAVGAGIDELAHAPWTHRLSDDVVGAAAARMRIVSTLDIHGHGTSSSELAVAMDNLRRFHAAGGQVVYGTDLGNGPVPPGIHVRELRWLAEAGLDADEVASALIRAPIEPGAPADLIALRESPATGPDAFDDLLIVVRGGRIVTAEPGNGSTSD
jgi:imidazolonepropionase-like amidohydrolase